MFTQDDHFAPESSLDLVSEKIVVLKNHIPFTLVTQPYDAMSTKSNRVKIDPNFM